MLRKFYLTLSLILLGLVSFAQRNKVSKPKIVIGIVIDQMRADYLSRFYNDYSDGGFKRLMSKGMNCKNANYNYVPTYTGPGHASIYTGTTPMNHGIVANNWFSRKENKEVNCVEDSAVSPIEGSTEYGQFSPHRLKSNTITDQLKITNNESKVISVSLKNRGAILPGGHMSDGSYWFDYSNGKFITSSYFKKELPKWLKDFNALEKPKKALVNTWDLFLEESDYSESREDNYAFEVTLPGKSEPTFPYDFKEMNKGITTFDLFGYTPESNSVLFDLAKEAIQAEGLGSDNHTDILNVSISATDIIGHAFGPYSREIQDVYIRLDRDIEAFLQFLDKEIGKGEYLVFLTADHAVEPIPQYLMDHKLAANYFAMDTLRNVVAKTIKQHLQQEAHLAMKDSAEFGYILSIKNQQIYLDKEQIRDQGFDFNKLITAIKHNLMEMQGVKHVYTPSDLMTNSLATMSNLVGKGVHSKESGDIIVLLEPGYLSVSTLDDDHKKGTSHGSPYGYDTDVPLIWYGAKTPVKEVYRRIEITDIAATVLKILGLQKTNGCTGEVIHEYFE